MLNIETCVSPNCLFARLASILHWLSVVSHATVSTSVHQLRNVVSYFVAMCDLLFWIRRKQIGVRTLRFCLSFQRVCVCENAVFEGSSRCLTAVPWNSLL